MARGCEFIGRATQRNKIKNFLSQNDYVLLAVSGLNRIGKSFLVEVCKEDFLSDSNNAKVCFILRGISAKCEEISEKKNKRVVCSFWTGFAQNIADVSKKFLDNETYAEILDLVNQYQELTNAGDLGEKLVTILKKLEEQQLQFVLHIDEFDNFKGIDDSFYEVLNSLVSASAPSDENPAVISNFKVIFCSRVYTENVWAKDRKEEFGKLFTEERGNCIRLNGFNAEELDTFYAGSQKAGQTDAERTWVNLCKTKEEIKNKIEFYCGNHPNLLQDMKKCIIWEIQNKKIITAKKIEDYGKNSDIFVHLYHTMQNDTPPVEEQSKLYNVTFSELFLRSFSDKFDYSYLDERDSAGNVVTHKEKCNEQLYKAGFINKKDDSVVGYSDCTAIAEYAETYIINRWQKQLDKLMEELDELEGAIRDLLSEKLIERFGSRQSAEDELLRNVLPNAKNLAGRMRLEYLYNNQKLPEYLYMLDSLAFYAYKDIMDAYWNEPHFEIFASKPKAVGEVWDLYTSLMMKLEDAVDVINNNIGLGLITGLSPGATQNYSGIVDKNNLRQLSEADIRKLKAEGYLPISFARLRNLAKHRNNLNILNPQIYSVAKEYCQKMLKDKLDGNALLHEKYVYKYSVKNAMENADFLSVYVKKRINGTDEYSVEVEWDGKFYNAVLKSISSIELNDKERYLIRKEGRNQISGASASTTMEISLIGPAVLYPDKEISDRGRQWREEFSDERIITKMPTALDTVERGRRIHRIEVKRFDETEHCYKGVIFIQNDGQELCFAADIDFDPKDKEQKLENNKVYRVEKSCTTALAYQPEQKFKIKISDAFINPDNAITKNRPQELPEQKEQKATPVKQEEPPKTKINPEAGQYYILTVDKNKGVFKKSETILSDPVAVSFVSDEKKNDKKNTKNNSKNNSKNNAKNAGKGNAQDILYTLNEQWVKVISVDTKEVKIQKAAPVISKFIGGVCRQAVENAETVELQVAAWVELECQLEKWVDSLTQVKKELVVNYDKEVTTIDDLKKVLDEVVLTELCTRFGENDELKEWLTELGDAKDCLLEFNRNNKSIDVLKKWKTVYDAFADSAGKKEDFINWLNTNVDETQLEYLTECQLKNPSLIALKEWIKWVANVSKDAMEDLALAKRCDLEGVKKISELSAWLNAEKAKILAASATDEVTAEAAATEEPK